MCGSKYIIIICIVYIYVYIVQYTYKWASISNEDTGYAGTPVIVGMNTGLHWEVFADERDALPEMCVGPSVVFSADLRRESWCQTSADRPQDSRYQVGNLRKSGRNKKKKNSKNTN